MNLQELKNCLQSRPELKVAVALPDGRLIPAHYHVTEVGYIAKKFIDCGGTFRASEVCVLQTHIGSPRDDGHRLSAGRLAKILDQARPILPAGDLPVEVEFESGVISQFPVKGAGLVGGTLTLQLGRKHTDCLAKAQCGIGDSAAGKSEPDDPAGCCVAPAGSQACC